MEQEIKLRRDFMQRLLCVHCWDGLHYGFKLNPKGERMGVKVSRCLRNGCECLCVALLEEQEVKRKARV